MTPVFRDRRVEPTPDRIHAALGSAAEAWDDLDALISHSGALLAWRYYRDGGWLAKASLGPKTVAWLSVEQGHVTITFYFAERHRSMLAQDPALTEELRDRIATAGLSGRLLPVTLEVYDSSRLPEVRAVLAAKLGAK